MKKIKNKMNWFNSILFTMLAIYSLSLLLPILWGIFTALKDVGEFNKNVVGLPNGHIWEWKWSNIPYIMNNFYVEIVSPLNEILYIDFLHQIINTFLYAGGGAFVTTFVCCTMAYCSSKYKCKVSSIIYWIVIITMMLPIVGSYPSELKLLQNLHIYDKIWGNWIQKANFLGMYFLVFFATFKGLSPAFSEAAEVDGANEWTIYFKINLPLVRNIFLTIVLIKFIEFWNDYQTPLLYLPSHPTLAYGIYYLSNSRHADLNNVPMRMAGCVIMVVPIMVLFITFKDKLIGNLSMGGVKG